MLLAIDVGNTNTVFAIHDGTRFVANWRCATEHLRTADEYYVWLSTLISLHRLEVRISRMVVSSVVPQVIFNLRRLAEDYFGCRALIVGRPPCRLPVEVRVDPGTQVGADRLVNTVAAHDRYGGDLIVVDFGTATTFDVVDSDGAYIGGVIAPGVNLSLRALHEAAAALPLVEITRPDRAIGTNTVACMQSGVYWGYRGLIEGITRQIRAEHGRPMRVIGTGGLAALFAAGEDGLFDALDRELTMHGLVVIDRFNREHT
ncbi:MAG: type III pantothenate kinase [Alphaproteobacteria bacterium]|nr:MAG: type III pantothenate kinase [Alphaproteobacteria bacterium]